MIPHAEQVICDYQSYSYLPDLGNGVSSEKTLHTIANEWCCTKGVKIGKS